MTLTIAKTTKPAVTVSAYQRTSAIVWKWTEGGTDDAALDYYVLHRYPTLADAEANTNATLIQPIYEMKYRDEEALTDDTNYWARVSWVDEWGNESALSNAVNEKGRKVAVTDTDQTVLPAPTATGGVAGGPFLPVMLSSNLPSLAQANQDVNGDGRTDIALRGSCPAVTGAVRYDAELWRSDTVGGTYVLVEPKTVPGPLAVFAANTNFWYKVKFAARSFNGTQGTFSAFSAPIKPSPPPNTVGTVTIASVSQVPKGAQIVITPLASVDISEYKLYVNTVDDPATATLVRSFAGSSVTDTTLRTDGVTYWYYVTAVNYFEQESLVKSAGVSVVWSLVKTADIAPAAVTTTEIAPTAVTPTRIFPREFANLFSDPEMLEPDENLTIVTGATSIVRVANDQANPLGPGRFMAAAQAVDAMNYETALSGPVDMPVEGGISYRASSWIGGTKDFLTADPLVTLWAAYLYIDFYQVDSSGTAATLISTVTLAANTIASQPVFLDSVIVAPALAQIARMRCRRTFSGGTTNQPTTYWASPELRRMTYADEIYNGVMQKQVYNAIGGLTLSNNASDPTNDIDIAPGSCADSANGFGVMELTYALTKSLDASWVFGNGGGLDTGSVANGTYHVWAIKLVSTTGSAVDVLFSLSATSPTMPSGWTLKRRIGSILREGGSIVTFKQIGDVFTRNVPVADVAATNPGTSAVLRALSVPTGIKVFPHVTWFLNNGSTNNLACIVTDPDCANTAPSTAGPFTLRTALTSAGGGAFVSTIATDTSAQIRTRFSSSGASDILYGTTFGWTDKRGQ